MFIIKNKFIFLTISAVIVLSSLIALAVYGLRLSIDFKGGTQLEVSYTTSRPDIASINKVLAADNVSDATAQPEGDLGLSIKSHPLTETQRTQLESDLSMN